MPVIITETAARELAVIIKLQKLDPDKVRLRVGVKGGGCSGFSYILDLVEDKKECDEEWEYSYEKANKEPFNLKVVCDATSYLYLNGTTIDFKDILMGRGFVFENPNASSNCGCGSSFSA